MAPGALVDWFGAGRLGGLAWGRATWWCGAGAPCWFGAGVDCWVGRRAVSWGCAPGRGERSCGCGQRGRLTRTLALTLGHGHAGRGGQDAVGQDGQGKGRRPLGPQHVAPGMDLDQRAGATGLDDQVGHFGQGFLGI